MDVKASLLQSFEEILDKMAFMYFEEPEDDEPVAGEFAHTTQIQFKGVINGTLHVFFSPNLAEQIARNLVGIRPDDELFEGTVADAILEFTNMVMGHTMTTLAPDHRFDMGVPEVVQDPREAEPGQESFTIEGYLDEDAVKLVLDFQEGAA